MDSVERDQRYNQHRSERGEKLFRRDAGEIKKKGKPGEKPPMFSRADDPEFRHQGTGDQNLTDTTKNVDESDEGKTDSV